MRRFLHGTIRRTKELGRPDIPLLCITLVLLGAGLIMVYSSSAVIGLEKFGSSNFFLRKQFMRAAMGLAVMAFFASLDYRTLRRFALPAFAGSIVLLAALVAPGVGPAAIRGTRGWLKFLTFQVQPSEFSRIALAMLIASMLSRSGIKVESFRNGLLPALIVIGVVLGLVVIQPDMGSAAAIALASAALLYVAGARLWHLAAVAASAVSLAALILKPYQLGRITSFMHGGSDLLGKEWQLRQSLISLGSGGLAGRGPGQGVQKFYFLPDLHTDFIFSIIGEEMGFVGTVAILVLFFFWVVRGLSIAAKAPDRFGFLLSASLTFGVMTYVILNVAVATGVAPTTGLPLPFISYGGSALMVNLAATGIILSVSRVSSGKLHGKSFG